MERTLDDHVRAVADAVGQRARRHGPRRAPRRLLAGRHVRVPGGGLPRVATASRRSSRSAAPSTSTGTCPRCAPTSPRAWSAPYGPWSRSRSSASRACPASSRAPASRSSRAQGDPAARRLREEAPRSERARAARDAAALPRRRGLRRVAGAGAPRVRRRLHRPQPHALAAASSSTGARSRSPTSAAPSSRSSAAATRSRGHRGARHRHAGPSAELHELRCPPGTSGSSSARRPSRKTWPTVDPVDALARRHGARNRRSRRAEEDGARRRIWWTWRISRSKSRWTSSSSTTPRSGPGRLEAPGTRLEDAGDALDALRYQQPRLRAWGASGRDAGELRPRARGARGRNPGPTFFLWKGRAFTYGDADRA